MPSEPYRPRPIAFHGVREQNGWRLKTYSIVYGAPEIDWNAYDAAWPLVHAALPTPAASPDRPGVGFVIAHTGRDVYYLVLGWWDRENELPLRVFVRELGTHGDWRPARGAESVCVWDLDVIGFERDAYVATVLTRSPDAEAYLNRWLKSAR